MAVEWYQYHNRKKASFKSLGQVQMNCDFSMANLHSFFHYAPRCGVHTVSTCFVVRLKEKIAILHWFFGNISANICNSLRTTTEECPFSIEFIFNCHEWLLIFYSISMISVTGHSICGIVFYFLKIMNFTAANVVSLQIKIAVRH